MRQWAFVQTHVKSPNPDPTLRFLYSLLKVEPSPRGDTYHAHKQHLLVGDRIHIVHVSFLISKVESKNNFGSSWQEVGPVNTHPPGGF